MLAYIRGSRRKTGGIHRGICEYVGARAALAAALLCRQGQRGHQGQRHQAEVAIIADQGVHGGRIVFVMQFALVKELICQSQR